MGIFGGNSCRDNFKLMDAPGTKIVGWGSQGCFEYFFHLLKYKPDYLVDNDDRRWGIEVNNVKVYSPQKLLEENPDNTFVIIFSSFADEIGMQLDDNGFLNYASAGVIAGNIHFEGIEGRLLRIFAAEQVVGLKEHGIVIQGQIIPDYTEYVVKSYRCLFGNARIVLSTWNNTDSSLLNKCAKYADDLVLSTLPQNKGAQNRNCQIVLTNAGLNKLKEHKLRYVMKTRTDVFVFNKNIFELVERFSKYGNEACTAIGLCGRIFVPATFSKEKTLYNPSDIVIVAHQTDMERYCDVELDLADDQHGQLLPMQNDLQSGIDKYCADSYICRKFFEKCGLKLEFTLEHSNSIYRDYFCILDDEQFDLAWIKRYSKFDEKKNSNAQEYVSHNQWLSLQIIKKRDDALDRIKDDEISFVVQGSISEETSYTINSIRKYFPNSKIILSTWVGADVCDLSKDIEVVFNEDPGHINFYHTKNSICRYKKNNINRQIVSTLNGLKKVSTKYAAKIRSDLVITDKNFVDMFYSQNDNCKNSFNVFAKKIFITNLFTIDVNKRDMPHHPSDLFQFGLTKDLIKLWDVAHMTLEDATFFEVNTEISNPEAFAHKFTVEQHIWLSCLAKNNVKFKMPAHYHDVDDVIRYESDMLINGNFIIKNFESSDVYNRRFFKAANAIKAKLYDFS